MIKPLFGVITDLHLCESNLIEIYNSCYKAIIICKQNGVNQLFIIGDIFDERKALSFNTLQMFGKILQLGHNEGIYIHLIPGNHDKISYKHKKSYLDIYSHYPGVELYRDLSFIKLDKWTIYLLPFFDEKTELVSRLNSLKKLVKGGSNLLLTHIAIDGVRNNDGTKVDGVVNRKVFTLFDKVLVGHYHDKQVIDNITYIGSIVQHNYGEDELKGLTLFNEDGSLSQHFVGDKKFLTVDIDLSKYKLEEVKSTLVNIYKDSPDRIRFKFTGTKEQLQKISRTEFTSKGIDVAIKQQQELDLNLEEETVDFSGFNKQKILEEWRGFCKVKDREVFYEEGKQLLEK